MEGFSGAPRPRLPHPAYIVTRTDFLYVHLSVNKNVVFIVLTLLRGKLNVTEHFKIHYLIKCALFTIVIKIVGTMIILCN